VKSLEFIPIAEISSVVNKQGDLNLVVIPGFADSFSELDVVFIDVFGDRRKFIVENLEFSDKGALIKFSNFDSAEDVEFLLHKKVFVAKQVSDDKEKILFSDLIGYNVFYCNEFFGLVSNVERYPGNDVISIKKKDGSEVLLPFVDEYFGNIDINKKRIELVKKVEFADDED
jgi:16S rRNA processing protein RimM